MNDLESVPLAKPKAVSSKLFKPTKAAELGKYVPPPVRHQTKICCFSLFICYLQPPPDGPPDLPGSKKAMPEVRSRLLNPTAAATNAKYTPPAQSTKTKSTNANGKTTTPDKRSHKSPTRSVNRASSCGTPTSMSSSTLPTVYENQRSGLLGPPLDPPKFVNGREVTPSSARQTAQMSSSMRLSSFARRTDLSGLAQSQHMHSSLDDSFVNRRSHSQDRRVSISDNVSVISSSNSKAGSVSSTSNSQARNNLDGRKSYPYYVYSNYAEYLRSQQQASGAAQRSQSVPKRIPGSSHLLEPTTATKNCRYAPPEVRLV
jgi:hypothetical protein